MHRTGNLFNAIVSFGNLWYAAHKAWRGKKDKTRIADFYFNLERELLVLQEELVSGQYQPRPYHVFEVTDPKRREIAAADFRDRVVHHAMINILDPLFEKRLIFDTYACRTGKGTHAAVQRAQQFSKQLPFFLKCDIRKYFQSVDHAILQTLLVRIIKDQRVLDLLARIIAPPVPGHPPGKGIPIGNLTSQHFANLYLGEMDHFIKERLRVAGYLRYMDDFLFFGQTKSLLHEIHFEIRQFLHERLSLILKDRVTTLAPVNDGIPFLGCRIFPSTIRLPQKGLARFRSKLYARESEFFQGKISETLLSRSVGSMIGHMVHADTLAMRRKWFTAVVDLG
ncbi:MAG: group II intron reverse transcriptase domain-containing protein [Magnetococcales bacterium]|nr:group II intron reverse transcriptase domain-containing protein [Magnetococcales bacterium]